MFFHRSNLFSKFTNFLFPINCIGCKKEGLYLCQKCISNIEIAKETPYPFIFAIFSFKNSLVRNAIYLLKYKGRYTIAKILAPFLCDQILEILAEEKFFKKEKPILIPIPMYRKRLRKRNYNHSNILAKECQKILGAENIVFENKTLHKNKETKQQALIKNKRDRILNINNSFIVKDESKIKGRDIFLIDDVTTSGATLKEARRVLKKSGARKVLAFVIAH